MTDGVFPASKPDWSNIDIIHRNTLPPRSHFSLHRSEDDARSESQPCSFSLSGTWKFQYSDNPFEAPQGFEAPEYDVSGWSDIQVPGHWQLQGWRNPHYSNVNYIFPVDPPNISLNDNQTGSYVTRFVLPETLLDEPQQVRLRFEGVDSAFHVYLNGQEVGYSQGSRNPSEFDVTTLITEHENTLAVRVYQFCDGSYIEDQDQWRLSGIFRDVHVVTFPKERHIQDFHVATILDGEYRDAVLEVRVATHGIGPVALKLFSRDGQVVATQVEESDGSSMVKLDVPVSKPKLWTAESPNLYKLVLSFGNRFVAHHVGFRKVEIKDGIFQVNGKRIVFRGVNRHEHRKHF
jgi:beta-galactosidase